MFFSRKVILFVTAFTLLGLSGQIFAAKTKDSAIEEQSTDPNLVSPNESSGTGTDQDKVRKYYDKIENSRRRENQKKEEEQAAAPVPQELPERKNKNAATVKISRLEMTESEIFTRLETDAFAALVEGKELSAEDLNNFVAIINEQYKARKIITAFASLKEGDLQDGVLRIELMEARIGKITVEGNRFNRKWYLKRALSKREGKVLDLRQMEKDLRSFNRNARSVQVAARLEPGEEYGTTDVILKADEQIPYHLNATFDNFGRDTTGLLRGGVTASADTLFGFQDRLTLAANISRSGQSPFVDYNVPLNRYGTRLGASYIFNHTKVTEGQYKDFDLESMSHVVSTYAVHPLLNRERIHLNLSASANVKFSNSYIADNKYSFLRDYNMAIGAGLTYNFDKSTLTCSLYSTNGAIEDVIQSKFSFFTKINTDAYYVYFFPKSIVGTVKFGLQFSPQNIASLEQYQIGGISSVRGYSESLLLAPTSYFTSIEFLFPIPFLPQEIKLSKKKDITYRLRDSIKIGVFIDHGAVFYHNDTVRKENFLLSAGAGLRATFSKYGTARVYVGVPILNREALDQKKVTVNFDLMASFF